MSGMDKLTALTKYLEAKSAVIEVNDGETEEEAWRRYLDANPGNTNTLIKIFHYPAKVSLSKARDHLEAVQSRQDGQKKHG